MGELAVLFYFIAVLYKTVVKECLVAIHKIAIKNNSC